MFDHLSASRMIVCLEGAHRLIIREKEAAESKSRRVLAELLGRRYWPYITEVVSDELVATLDLLPDTLVPVAAENSASALLAVRRAVAACPSGFWYTHFHAELNMAENRVRDVVVWRCKAQVLPLGDPLRP